MRKVYFLLMLFLLFFSHRVLSQQAFQQGDVLVNAGLSIGVFNYGLGARHPSGFPVPLTANLEWGITDMIGVGPYAGYLYQGYETTVSRHSRTTFTVGAQAAFHLSPFLNEQLELQIQEELMDFYVKAIVGYEWYMEQQNGVRLPREFLTPPSRIIFGPVVGLRYMLGPAVSVYAEGGRGPFGWLTLGLSLKL
jgi:hypothetical protein